MPVRNGAALFQDGIPTRLIPQVRAGRLARTARAAARTRALVRAARVARLAALAGSAVVAPEAALAAAAIATAAGAYKLGKTIQARKARANREAPALPKLPLPAPLPKQPKSIPLPATPDIPPMAPSTPKNTSGRKKVVVPRFNPVSMITKAPVAIGNTIRGTTTIERMTRYGQACIGRDFMFTPIAPGAVANWTMVGGCPLSPTAFADSLLRQYAQMYNKFRFLAFTAHFITSSPTSTNGDVMFYYAKNRESPYLNQTSINLLPFVMSDPNAVIGPQWLNMSATFDVDSEWKSLDYGIDDAPKEYAAGELFLLCKTSNTESPGYVIFDYTIEFGEKSIQPRLLSLPITREIYSQVGLASPTGAVVINTPYSLRAANLNISGSNSVMPTGAQDGDIYKVIIDVTNSNFVTNGNFVTTSLYGHETPGNSGTIVMSDGFTCYAVFQAANNALFFYLNCPSAYSGATNRQFWASNTGAVSFTLQVWLSYVGSTNYALSNVSNF